jgi:hypothetical protein
VTIAEAFRAVEDEYNKECIRAREESSFNELMGSVIVSEYQEIDEVLPDCVAGALTSLEMPPGILDSRIYIMVRLVFRAGMRTQRKLDRPDQETSTFWRSDQRGQ